MASTRRKLLGASALLAFSPRVLPAAAAGIPVSDADLIRWTDEAIRADERAAALTCYALADLPAPVEAVVEAEYRIVDDRVQRVIGRAAVSAAGLAAKAKALRHFTEVTCDGALHAAADVHDRLAWSLTGDLLGCGMAPSQGQAVATAEAAAVPEPARVAHPDGLTDDLVWSLVAGLAERT